MYWQQVFILTLLYNFFCEGSLKPIVGFLMRKIMINTFLPNDLNNNNDHLTYNDMASKQKSINHVTLIICTCQVSGHQ